MCSIRSHFGSSEVCCGNLWLTLLVALRWHFFLFFLVVAMQRLFFSNEEIAESHEATAVLRAIYLEVRSRMQVYQDLDLHQLQAILSNMNSAHSNVSQMIVFCNAFGGLVHVQISVVAGEDAWVLLPVGPRTVRPIDRLALQSNGLMCTMAPPAALAAWNAAPARHYQSISAEGVGPMGRKRCANCNACGVPMRSCGGCGLARYCTPACQRDHWRGHKALCRWVQECNAGRF